MSAATDFLENRLLTQVLTDQQVYIGLWTNDPGDDPANPPTPPVGEPEIEEVSGGMYERKPANFTVSGGTASLTHDIVWVDMPTTRVGALVIYDAPEGGNPLLHGPLVAVKEVSAGDSFALPAANVTVSCD